MAPILGALILPALAAARPEVARQHKAQGDRLLQQGSVAEAAAAYRKAIAEEAGWLVAYDALASAHLALDQHAKVIELLEPVLQVHPDHATGWYAVAYAYRKTGDNARSVDAYRRHLELAPDNVTAWYGLGKALLALGRDGEALGAFEHYAANEKRPSERTWVEKARKVAGDLKKKGARPKLDDMPTPADTSPAQFAAVLCAQGAEALAAGKAADAARLSERALAMDRNATCAYDGIGETYPRLGRHAEAIPLFRKALADNPNYSVGWTYLGTALAGASRPAQAIDALRRATELLPNHPDAHRELGLLLAQQGDATGARAALSAYLLVENRPDRAADRKRAEQALAKLGGK